MTEPLMDAAQFLALWRAENARARRYVATLGNRRVGLASSLAALHRPGAPMSHYTSWLRVWDEPPIPTDLAGWAWEHGSLTWRRGAIRVTIDARGEQAFTHARAFLSARTWPQQKELPL